MELPVPAPVPTPAPAPIEAPLAAPVAPVPAPSAAPNPGVGNPFAGSDFFMFLVGASLVLAVVSSLITIVKFMEDKEIARKQLSQ